MSTKQTRLGDGVIKRTGTILVCDDEKLFREVVADTLSDEGHQVLQAGTLAQARGLLQQLAPDLLLLDLHLPDGDGLELLSDMATLAPRCLTVIVTAYADFDSAVQALRGGAHDYISKPLQLDDLTARMGRLLKYREVLLENVLLRRLARRARGPAAAARSPAMQTLMTQAQRVAERGRVCLITGESGAGKEVLARHVHACAGENQGVFVPVNLAAMPEGVAESQLFGHVRGAFTGADRALEGLARAAAAGTLFLDEISEAPLSLQAKLLRLVDRGEVLPVGATEPVQVQMRIIAATNRDLPACVAAGTFREDLYHRLNVVHLHVPSLRKRRDELPALCVALLEKLATDRGWAQSALSPAASAALQAYDWPGNVRELRNVLERALILGTGDVVNAEDLPAEIYNPGLATGQDNEQGAQSPIDGNLRTAVAAFEREFIRSAVAEVDGDRRAAAARLGIGLATLYRKMAGASQEADV